MPLRKVEQGGGGDVEGGTRAVEGVKNRGD